MPTNLDPAGILPFTVTGNDDNVLTAIAANAPFPVDQSGELVIGQLGFNRDFPVPNLDGSDMTFSAGVSVGSVFAAYTNSAKLKADLGFNDTDGNPLGIDFPATLGKRYLAATIKLDAHSSASGKFVLAPSVAATFGASGSVSNRFAYVLAVDTGQKAGDACLAFAQAWKTPATLQNAPLDDNCWMLVEAGGALNASLGIQAGYDFSWVKKIAVNQLDGDIGLRIKLGLQATLSASFAGQFYVVVNRESSATRVRMFRKSSYGWKFAMDSSADVTLQAPLPEDLEGFIQAILGIHDAQMLTYLSDVLASPDPVSQIGKDFGTNFLNQVGSTPDVQAALGTLKNLLGQWNNLGHTVSAVVWKYADSIPGLTALHDAATSLAEVGSDPLALQNVLGGYLKDVNFFKSPVGEWLESATSSSLFELYENGASSGVQAAATKLLGVLDGDTLQTALQKLQGKVSDAVNFDSLETALNSGSLASVAGWVQSQLAKFLGINLSDLPLTANLAKANQVVTTIRDKANDIYEATRKALNSTYGATLNASYEASDSNSALVDAMFADGSADARAAMWDVLRGDLTKTLSTPIAGVTLNVATLTHSLSRHEHVEVHLPWWSSSTDDLTKGVATGKFVDGVDGRVQFFESATGIDELTITRNTNLRRFSTCSFGISTNAQGVRQYNPQAVDFGYSFVTAGTNMPLSQLSEDLRNAVAYYFRAAVPDFPTWLAAVQSAAATSSAQNLGMVWSNLQVHFFAREGASWVGNLLRGIKPDYIAMSLSMQANLRRFILLAFCADPHNLGNDDVTDSVLVYSSMAPRADIKLNFQGQLQEIVPPQKPTWDTLDYKLVLKAVHAYAEPGLDTNLAAIQHLLANIPGGQNKVGSASSIQNQIWDDLQTPGAQPLIIGFLQAEKQVIDGAVSAFEALRAAGGKPPVDSLDAFKDALANLAQAFNSKIAELSFESEIMRNFTPIVLQEAVRSLYGSALFRGSDIPDAVLDVALLKDGVALPAVGESPKPEDTKIRQKIMNFA